MFKKLLKGIGVVLLSLVGIIIVIAAWSGYKSSQYEGTAIPYMDKAIPELSKWELDNFKKYLTPSVMEELNEKDLKTLIKGLSKMGELVEVGDYQFNTVTSRALTSGGSGTFVTYIVPAIGTIMMALSCSMYNHGLSCTLCLLYMYDIVLK